MAIGRELNASLVLRLHDRVSAGIHAITSRMDRLTAATRRFSSAGTAAGAAIGAISFGSLVQEAGRLEGKFRDISVTSGRTGSEVAVHIDRMRARIQQIAADRRLSTDGLTKGLDVIIGRGLDETKLDSYLSGIAEMASASGAAEDSIGGLFVALERMAGIKTPEGLRQASAAIFRLGQLGGVEAKDSAGMLPGILAQMQPLGVTGQTAVVDASAYLQVLRDAFGSGEQASAGLQALLGQVLSKDTVKNARAAGIDLPAIFRDAQRKQAAGQPINPVESLIVGLGQWHDKDPSKASENIPDQNARQAFLGIWQNRSRLIELRKEGNAATPAMLEQAASDREKGLASELRVSGEQLGQIGERFGRGFGEMLPSLNDGLKALNGYLKELDGGFPGLIDGALKWSTAIAGLSLAVGAAVPVIGRLVGFLNPWAAGVTAVAGAALLIYENWDGVAGFFDRLWTGVSDSFGQAAKAIEDRLAKLKASIFGGEAGGAGAGAEGVAPPPATPGQPTPLQDLGRRRWGARGKLKGVYGDDDPMVQLQSFDPSRGGASRADDEWKGRIAIDIGFKGDRPFVQDVRMTGPANVAFEAPDRGLMLGRA